MDFNTAERLLSSGAITEQQYRDLIRALSLSPVDQTGSPTATTQSGSGKAFQTATAAVAGAVAGSLAASLITNAVTDPSPELIEVSLNATTIWTEGGYITQAEMTFENADGEIVAGASYNETASMDESALAADAEVSQTIGLSESGIQNDATGLDCF